MTLSRTRFLDRAQLCRAIDTRRDEDGVVRDRQCSRRTILAVMDVPLCFDHRGDREPVLIVDDDGRTVPMPKEQEAQA